MKVILLCLFSALAFAQGREHEPAMKPVFNNCKEDCGCKEKCSCDKECSCTSCGCSKNKK